MGSCLDNERSVKNVTCHAKTILTLHCNANHVTDNDHLCPLDLPQIPWLNCTGNISILGFGRELARHYLLLL